MAEGLPESLADAPGWAVDLWNEVRMLRQEVAALKAGDDASVVGHQDGIGSRAEAVLDQAEVVEALTLEGVCTEYVDQLSAMGKLGDWDVDKTVEQMLEYLPEDLPPEVLKLVNSIYLADLFPDGAKVDSHLVLRRHILEQMKEMEGFNGSSVSVSWELGPSNNMLLLYVVFSKKKYALTIALPGTPGLDTGKKFAKLIQEDDGSYGVDARIRETSVMLTPSVGRSPQRHSWGKCSLSLRV